jgi:GT2 family glycosyltransferase/glycosyltransferase involved in cell wall biosynthesis
MTRDADEPRFLPTVGIVILNWNGWRDTIECLESVRKQTYSATMTILVDNGSTDDSIERILAWGAGRFPVPMDMDGSSSDKKPVDLATVGLAGAGNEIGATSGPEMVIIRTGKNLGYSGGNNVGMRYALKAGCRYIWILNNDTVAAPDSLEELVRAAETTAGAGLVGSRLFNYDEPDTVQSIGYDSFLWRLFSRAGKRPRKILRSVLPVKWITGSSLIVRREMIRDVGMLDEAYFLFNEEVDWCVRAGRKGWSSYCATASIVWHKWGGSFPGKRTMRSFLGWKALRLPWVSFSKIMYYEARNAIYFVRRNFPAYLAPYLFLRTVHLVLQVLLYDRDGFRRIRIILKGTWDGLTGRMGKAHGISGGAGGVPENSIRLQENRGEPGSRAVGQTAVVVPRPGSEDRARVLVSFCRAYPPESGSASVTYNLARHLPGTRYLVQVTERKNADQAPPGFGLIEISGLPQNKYAKAFWLITKYSNILQKIREKNPAIVFLEGSSWSLYPMILFLGLRRRLRRTKFVYHAHNVEYSLRRSKDNRLIALISRWAEGILIRQSDLALAVSPNDAREFEALYGIRPAILPNSVDTDWFRDISDKMVLECKNRYRLTGSSVLFMGLIGFPPNDEAVDFLINDVFPRVRRDVPSARLIILGGKIRARQTWLENPGMVPFEEVPVILKACDVCVAPIFSGSGTRLKILEYLASGKPVVATTKAAEGLAVQGGRDLLIADSPNAFAASVTKLLTDTNEALRLSRHGQATVQTKYSWRNVVVGLDRKLELLLRGNGLEK